MGIIYCTCPPEALSKLFLFFNIFFWFLFCCQIHYVARFWGIVWVNFIPQTLTLSLLHLWICPILADVTRVFIMAKEINHPNINFCVSFLSANKPKIVIWEHSLIWCRNNILHNRWVCYRKQRDQLHARVVDLSHTTWTRLMTCQT